MSKYAQHVQTKQTPQSEKILGSTQVANSSGGFSFPVDCWTRLDRFLILGCEGGSYYATEKKLTQENATAVQACLDADPARTIQRIVTISHEGRAPKNDPAVFALALAASHKQTTVRQAALTVLPLVCRIGTHLFQFAAAVDQLRGWSKSLQRAVRQWYLDRGVCSAAFQAVKYQQRDGWAHRDLMRLSHFGKETYAHPEFRPLYQWIVGGWQGEAPVAGDADSRAVLAGMAVRPIQGPGSDLELIWAFERAKQADEKETIQLIRDYDLPREAVMTKHLNSPAVWEALLERMPLEAMTRNLATMTRVGLLAPLSSSLSVVQSRLTDQEKIVKARLHPVKVLAALLTYKQGHGERGSHTWSPVSQIVDALDGAFYLAFKAVVPTGKRWLLACDISGSMWGGNIAGVPGLTPGLGTACMALVTANAEPQHHFVAFTSGGYQHGGGRSMHYNLGSGLTDMTISPRQRLDDVATYMRNLIMGGTDCALPMLYATERKLPVDVFVVLTDSETWAGNIHPVQALQQYRQKTGIGAKMVVVGMVSNGFSIADPTDSGMLDCVGFDTNTPAAMSEFVRL